MLPHLLIERSFPTPVGVVNCGLSSNKNIIKITDNVTYDNGKSIVFQTLAHIIEVITFKSRLPLYNGQSVTDREGWIWRITKNELEKEILELHCLLTDFPTGIQLGGDPGEHLDAISANNNDWMLHIGTEDGEVMHFRALNDDGMPSRFMDSLGFSQSFTSMQLNGMITNVPELIIGEKVHFHYLTAYDKYEERTVNTWLAVDEFKHKLENWIGVW